jgi:hypothetical protein
MNFQWTYDGRQERSAASRWSPEMSDGFVTAIMNF